MLDAIKKPFRQSLPQAVLDLDQKVDACKALIRAAEHRAEQLALQSVNLDQDGADSTEYLEAERELVALRADLDKLLKAQAGARSVEGLKAARAKQDALAERDRKRKADYEALLKAVYTWDDLMPQLEAAAEQLIAAAAEVSRVESLSYVGSTVRGWAKQICLWKIRSIERSGMAHVFWKESATKLSAYVPTIEQVLKQPKEKP